MRNSLLHFFCVCAILMLTGGAADAQTFTVLYNFGSFSADPSNPQYSGVIVQGRDGNLYTTSPFGGIGDGTVFKITPGGNLSVIFEASQTPGFQPYGGLILGTDGNFYGTNYAGGTSYDAGTIFKITPSGTLTDLYDFTAASDGSLPYAPPIQGTDGNFYGTTSFNGSNNNYGTIYKVTPLGQLKTLYEFDYTHGANPY